MPESPRHPHAPGRRALGRRTLLPALGLLALPARHALAQTYPNRPIRFVVGFAAGNSTDLIARIIGEALRERLGQPVVVENRPGANGSLAAGAVAGATPDGHTLLVSNASTMTVNHLLYRDSRYQPLRDLLPVSRITASPFILTINPTNQRIRGVRTFQDLVALAKSRPGFLTYGSGGNGNLAHLATEMLCKTAGIQMVHVPYRGAAPAQTALVAGEVDLFFDTPSVMPLVQAGTLSAIACAGPVRWRDLPDVPTVAESGYPDFNFTFWTGLVAPAGTPAPIVTALAEVVKAATQEAGVRQRLLPHGDIALLDPAAFRTQIAAEIEANAAVIRAAGIEMQ